MNLKKLIPAVVLFQPLTAGPPEITPEELAEFERKVAPRMIPDIDGEKNLNRALPLEKKVEDRLISFLESVDEPILIAEEAPAPADDTDPLEDLFKPDEEAIVINCSKGIYLDGENREIVYLGDIKMQGQGLTMTCKKDLKAIFDAPPEKPKDKNEKTQKESDDPLSKFGGFGDLKQLTATGTVRLNGVDEDGKKIYIGGDRALYEMTKKGKKTDSTVTMRGEKLAFMIGDPNDPKNKDGVVALRSISPKAWIVAEVRNNVIKVRTSDDGWQTVVIPPKEEEE